MVSVTIYTTPKCSTCQSLKSFLAEHDITYEEWNVAEDTDAARDMVRKTQQREVPVTVIEDGDEETVLTGFDEDALQDILL